MITEREKEATPKHRRGSRARISIFAVLAILIVAASATVIPRVVGASSNKKPRPNLTTPLTKPSTQPSTRASHPPTTAPAVDTTGWVPRVSVMDGFWLRIPKTWKGGWFEGTWDFEPKGLPSLAEDGSTFALGLSIVTGEYNKIAPSSAIEFWTDAGPVRAWMVSPRHETYAIAWTACPGYVGDCSSPERTLIVQMTGSTNALWSKYVTVGRAVVRTIMAYDGSNPLFGRAPDYEGGADFPNDPVDTALVRFLDARVEGIGADELYCCDATALYAKDGLYYLNGSPATSWEFWRTAGIIGADNGRFRVVIHYRGGATRTEMISIGFQKGEAWPRNVPSVVAACTNCR